jgi:hypothetical protein
MPLHVSLLMVHLPLTHSAGNLIYAWGRAVMLETATGGAHINRAVAAVL